MRVAAATGAYVCFEDEAGQTLRPPKARTWGRRGHTPVAVVSGKGSGRVSAAAPVILVWDNLNTHVSATMRTFTGAHPDWLTVVQLPAYAPDLNPVEGAWANIRR